MKAIDLIEKMPLQGVNIADGEKEVENAYCGDFLSYAISKIKDNSVWFTVMNNQNVAGVAILSEVSLLVLCDDTFPDKNLLNKCVAENINIAISKKPIYETAVDFYLSINNEKDVL